MGRIRKRIRELVAPTREHPVCERLIRNFGSTPLVLCDRVGAYWDGMTVLQRDDQPNEPKHVPPDMREQILTMILAGEFGDDMKDVFLDGHRWQQIYDDLIDVPNREIIARDSLHLFRSAPNRPADRIGMSDLKEAGPTTGPRPVSWSGTIERNAAQASFTYAFQFGQRELWKIGHATDLTARLAEVNKHVPHEVLGEHWHLVLQQLWPSESDAYEMEQHVLKDLRNESSIGERVICTRRQLEIAWTSKGRKES